MEKTADATVSVPVTHPMLQPSRGVVPLQLFAYYVALQRGCDIDKPRNLAKSDCGITTCATGPSGPAVLLDLYRKSI